MGADRVEPDAQNAGTGAARASASDEAPVVHKLKDAGGVTVVEPERVDNSYVAAGGPSQFPPRKTYRVFVEVTRYPDACCLSPKGGLLASGAQVDDKSPVAMTPHGPAAPYV